MVLQDNQGRLVLASNGGNTTQFPEVLEWGHMLSEASVGVEDKNPKGLWEAKGWKEFVQHMPEYKRAITAVMLENCRRRFGALDEVTRTQALGTFDKWIFPVISNMSENDVIDQLVALQPMPGPTSNIVYLDIVTGKAKGATPAGTAMWRAMQGAVDRFNDSDELIEGEALGTTSGGGAVSDTLEYLPVRAGTVSVTIGAVTGTDDGNGVISSSTFSGTINYASGAISITGAAATTAATVTYAYNSEGNSNIMDYEVKISSSPVTAKALKLKALWSEEADQNLQTMYNIKMEPIMLNALTAALQYQKHRSVIYDLRNRADAGFVSWDAVPPTSVNYQTHKFSLIDAFESASNMIFSKTNTVKGNWVLCGLQAATVVVTLPQFVSKNNKSYTNGITYLGDLGDKKIFADPHFPQNEFLVGHKGDQFLRTGYVLAEYQKLYTTPDVQLDDFLHRRAFATSFAKKMINSGFYCRGVINNAPTQYGSTIG